MEDQKVYYVRASRRTRGSSYCCSFMLVPLFTVLIIGVLQFSSLVTILSLGPGQYFSNILKLEYLPLVFVLALLLSIILVVLLLPPKRIDQFIDWWHGL